jgi:hypothetical protein
VGCVQADFEFGDDDDDLSSLFAVADKEVAPKEKVTSSCTRGVWGRRGATGVCVGGGGGPRADTPSS